MLWTTVLTPLDGSPAAEIALPYTEILARALGAEVRLLSVVERRPRGLTSRSERIATAYEQEQRATLERYLAETADVLRRRDLAVEAAVATGSPAETILATADALPNSVIVMGMHGRAGVDRIDRWSIGGVADKVMRLSSRPTLLTRLWYTRVGEERPWRNVALSHLLVPLDGSPLAEHALAPAAELAKASGARLTILRVEPWLTEGSAPYGALQEFAVLEEEASAAATEYLAEARRRIPNEVEVDAAVLRGRPAESLIEFSLHERVDLVVMTTHGRGGLRRLVLGSTADRLVRSGVPTLLLRPGAGAVDEGDSMAAADAETETGANSQ